MATTGSSGKKRGRPLSFDRDTALDAAMQLFWRYGYEATSLRDLTEAMGVAPPSLYAAFGDKKALFLAVVARYAGEPAFAETMIASAPSARAAAWQLLEASAIRFTGSDTPPGCLMASATAACAAESADVQAAVRAIRQRTESALCARIADEFESRQLDWPERLSQDDEAAMLAGHIMAVIQGMSTLARDGATRESLLQIAQVAMRAWPPEL